LLPKRRSILAMIASPRLTDLTARRFLKSAGAAISFQMSLTPPLPRSRLKSAKDQAAWSKNQNPSVRN